MDDFSTGKISNIDHLPVNIVEESILNRKSVESLVRVVDAVVHLAAQPSVPLSVDDPLLSHEVNTNGTVYILEACRKYRKSIVFASSSAVYGPANDLPIRESLAPQPQTPYAANKLAAESYTLAYGATYGFPVLAFRFFNVYGPLQSPDHAYAAVIPSFIDAALHNKALTIYGDGSQTRDFTYVGSVATVLAETAARQVRHHAPVNLAFGTRTTVIGLARMIEEILGQQLNIVYSPVRAGDIRDSQASSHRMRELVPDTTEYTLEAGLRATIEWFVSLNSGRVNSAVPEKLPA